MDQSDPELIRLSLLANPSLMAQIRQQQPELAQAAQSDPQRFAQLLRSIQNVDPYEQQLQRQRQIDALNDDPFNADAQRKIEEMIQQEQILENLNNAMEYHPESFGRVTMLYIDVRVNGKNIKAFVDSGAQATIMSPACAEECGIMRLVDKRFAGVAHGVGTANILGRVHSAPITVGKTYLPCSFTIMEGKVDLLFGLDMLRRHQACIDLTKNVLRIGDEEVRFLEEHELPQSARDQPAATIEGPAGAQVDASSGAIMTQEEEKIKQLEGMGFARAECKQALEATNGDVEMAAGLLL